MALAGESLYPGEVIKLGWIAALQGLGVPSSAVLGLAPDSRAQIETGTLAPEVYEALVSGLATNTLSAEAQDFFLDASLARYGAEHPVTVPTMLLQGFNDTLFPFHQALESVDALAAAGAPVKLVGFCGSLSSAATGTGSGIVHGECPPWCSTEGNDARFQDLHVRWFDRWLRGEDVDTGPAVEVSSNEGVWHTLADATAFPGPGVETVAATLAGTLPASPLPSGGGAAVFATPSGPGAAVEGAVLTASDGPVEIVGVPRLRATVTPTGTGEVFLFTKLVDLDVRRSPWARRR